MDTAVITAPLRVNSQKEIGWLDRRAMPSMTTLALAPTAVRLPPKSAPSASAHHQARPGEPDSACSRRVR